MKKIIIGKTQELTALRRSDFGVYLGYEGQEEDAVLLPKSQVPADLSVGDRLSVFVYRDSEDRPVATVNSPYAEAGEFAWLRVKSVTRIGAFLDWGLEKDLFLPFKEQENALKSGETVLVYVYTDKSGRMCATMRIYDYLTADRHGNFRKGDSVVGYVYRVQPSVGTFVAVREQSRKEDRGLKVLYFGLIPKDQVFWRYRAGEKLELRVVRVREDGKLDLSARRDIVSQLDADGETILKAIDSYEGELPFSESASPEMIKRELHMSKAAFKRALGHLKKAGKVEIGPDAVRKL